MRAGEALGLVTASLSCCNAPGHMPRALGPLAPAWYRSQTWMGRWWHEASTKRWKTTTALESGGTPKGISARNEV